MHRYARIGVGFVASLVACTAAWGQFFPLDQFDVELQVDSGEVVNTLGERPSTGSSQ